MTTISTPFSFTPTKEEPATVYYCKAGIATGKTVRVMQSGAVIACSGVSFENASGEMLHGNATGKAKASGARCTLRLTSGLIHIQP